MILTGGNSNYLEQNPSKWHCVHHIHCKDWPGITAVLAHCESIRAVIELCNYTMCWKTTRTLRMPPETVSVYLCTTYNVMVT